MSSGISEIAKQAVLETSRNATSNEAKSRSAFNFPGEKDGFSGRHEVSKGTFEKQGSSFDGPWDNQEQARCNQYDITEKGTKGNFEESRSNLETKQEQMFDRALKEQIQSGAGWSDEIGNAIGSWEEYELYKKAGVVETKINGKHCLAKNIDLDQRDDFGRTNKERMNGGLSPIDKNGETIELHHIGQKKTSPLAELNSTEHRGRGNDSILHDKTKLSEIDRVAFNQERSNHWQERAQASQAG